MKNTRAEEIKKRIADRRKHALSTTAWTMLEEKAHSPHLNYSSYHFDDQVDQPDKGKPEVNRLMLRMLLSICLIVVMAVIYFFPSKQLEPVQKQINQAMETNFQFAMVSDWISKRAGDMYAILPNASSKANQGEAVTVSGKLIETFKENGKGIMVETTNGVTVKTIAAGVVIFAGEDKKYGKTVIVQQADKMNVWYGNLSDVSVTLYQHVDKGSAIGTVSEGKTSDHGEYYFAIEKENHFVDPIQVISLD